MEMMEEVENEEAIVGERGAYWCSCYRLEEEYE
jgi:hypothetical protein